ncbi:MocR-like pyridoxine biosynthesis transcription factor PdxR [Niallia sp. FSL W8-0635]|uniref:MocR-like pyridoxine biosynthesis transcription factor PdxR n=1 Tax=Niallia sp. FSL W8-0635 TaxID=2975337 RepID=UPI0009D20C73|nr:GntR family transcriptional regulator [Mycobacteroides abscessus subsp. abscessus]HEO8418781.1 PLP-dependent aminotransferase family protein [Yersinia enterocolitica]HEO8422826.1 PLP-dependent aminotransferase family protein [Yersinia enterocolitica]
MLELTPVLHKDSSTPLYIQLADFIKQEIRKNHILPNEKLPSKRKLATHLQISLNTVQAAYDQLCAEGYVESIPRKGLYVLTIDEEFKNQQQTKAIHIVKKTNKQEEVKIDFNSGQVDSKYFPYNIWRKLSMQSIYEDQNFWFSNGDPQGEFNLREQIAKHLYATRGVNCHPDQIIIGAGTQVLIGLIGLLLGRDKVYGLENPGYYRIRVVLQDMGKETLPIPVDENGMDVSQLSKSKANVAYVTPSHQFPYGMIMPITRRLELIKWAEKNSAFIIEDDYDGEYRYKGKPIPALQGLANNSQIIYLGTFSKSLIPSLRISYGVLPNTLYSTYQKQFTVYKQTVSRMHQDTLYRFIKDGHWNSHLNKMRTLYRKKRQVLLQAIHEHLGRNVEVIGENAGLHIVLEVKSDWNEWRLIEKALDFGVKVYPVSTYYFQNEYLGNPKVILGYGGLTETEIETGIELLKRAWELE